MTRKVFYSFHYKLDSHRASQVRNMGVIEGNVPVSDNDWEKIKGKGAKAIEDWINKQLKGKSCAVVLIGAQTSDRKWVIREIEKAWNGGKGVLGVHIHKLKNLDGKTSTKGTNPFSKLKLNDKDLSKIVKTYDPPGVQSTTAYKHIKDNLPSWVETAIDIRNRYS